MLFEVSALTVRMPQTFRDAAKGKGIEIVADDNILALVQTRLEGSGSKRSLQIELLKLQNWIKEIEMDLVSMLELPDVAKASPPQESSQRSHTSFPIAATTDCRDAALRS